MTIIKDIYEYDYLLLNVIEEKTLLIPVTVKRSTIPPLKGARGMLLKHGSKSKNNPPPPSKGE
jgi:hypothetical protein